LGQADDAVRLAVTGASGLVGRQVCRVARERDHEVRAVVRRPDPALARAGVRLVRANIDHEAQLERGFRDIDVVVHCAAVYVFGTAEAGRLEEVNVEGTRRVVAAAARSGVRRVVVTSSSVTCGSSKLPVAMNETNSISDEWVPAYYRSKQRQEAAAFAVGAEHGVEVVVACPGVVLGGPSGRLVPSNAIVLRYLLDPTRSTYPGGASLVEVGEVAAGHVLLAEAGQPGARYLLAGENLSWHALHALIGQLAGVGGPHAESTASWAYAASALSEAWAKLTGAEPLSTREEALTVGRYYWYDSGKAAALGYRAGQARQAVAASLAWLIAEGRVPRWVRAGLRMSAEVYGARALVPGP
jgi:dihydroflavonol-4-reductase